MRITGILSSVMLIAFASCAPKVYYQVFETQPENSEIKQQPNGLVYENDDCAVYYNFWGEGGDMGFRVKNKTDQPLFLDMGKSYFVLNGTPSGGT